LLSKFGASATNQNKSDIRLSDAAISSFQQYVFACASAILILLEEMKVKFNDYVGINWQRTVRP